MDKDHTVQWDFFVTEGRNSGKWSKIAVPSQWELQGFGNYNYGRDKVKSSEKGLYRYSFTVPERWKDKQICITFEGVMTDAEVKVNGKAAGPVHQGGFYRFSHNITPLVDFTKPNVLEVTVSKQSSNESVNKAERDADFWVFGGIFRPVYLEAFPLQSIERVAIDAKANGTFSLDVYLQHIKNAQLVEAIIKTLDGKPVGKPFAVALEKKSPSLVSLKTQVTDAKLWNPEFPNLYMVEVRLIEKDAIIHKVSQRFGFRTVEIRERDGIYVNEVKTKFKGVNRHSFWPTSGRTMSKDLSTQDVELMKNMNMNAVRMSHYPPDQHFLDVCDSLGLFVLDELTGWQDAYDSQVGKRLVKELVVRDVNHPSIIIWDNGNEGGWNTKLDNEFEKYDPQKRHVIHPWAIFRGTDTQHYKPYDCCTGSLFHGKNIFFPTEFLHGLYDGGHGAGLDDYWDLMWKHPLSAGGFLWVLADEGVIRVDKDSIIDTNGSHAPDGILGPYREKEASFYTIKEIWSPIQIEPLEITSRFNGELMLENRFHYTNLSQCKITWRLANYPLPADKSSQFQTPYEGTQIPPSIEPGNKRRMKLNLPNKWAEHDAIVLTATDPHGRQIYTWSFPINTPQIIAKRLTTRLVQTNATGNENKESVTVSANGVEAQFSKKTGYLSAVKSNGKTISFTNGPRLVAGSATFSAIKHYAVGSDYVVEVQYKGDLTKLVWRMQSNGWLKLDYQYKQTGAFDFAGITFDYPEDKVTGMKWMGNGPYRVWKNRTKGAEFGEWKKAYNDTRTGESWKYPEFKGYHANLYWVVVENKEQPFTIVSETEDLFLRMLTPVPPKGAYNNNTAPVFPEGDISILHGISPIGTKFLKAEMLGHASQKNMYFGEGANLIEFAGTLYFDFGIKK